MQAHELQVARVGLLSDSHGRHERTARAVAQLVEGGAEVLVHLGDVNSREVLDSLLHEMDGDAPWPPVHVVFGNTDWQVEEFSDYALSLGIAVDHPVGRLEIGGKSLVFQHGDRWREMDRALAEGVTYLCHGHTHVVRDERMGPTRVINPGALQRAQTYNVGLLDVELDELRILTVPR